MVRTAAIAMMVAAIGALPGCFGSERADLDSQSPNARIKGIVEAAESGESEKIPELIERLEAFDPAERFLAIVALERLTGERFAYDYAAEPLERDAAIARWIEWAEAQGLLEPRPSAARTEQTGAQAGRPPDAIQTMP